MPKNPPDDDGIIELTEEIIEPKEEESSGIPFSGFDEEVSAPVTGAPSPGGSVSSDAEADLDLDIIELADLLEETPGIDASDTPVEEEILDLGAPLEETEPVEEAVLDLGEPVADLPLEEEILDLSEPIAMVDAIETPAAIVAEDDPSLTNRSDALAESLGIQLDEPASETENPDTFSEAAAMPLMAEKDADETGPMLTFTQAHLEAALERVVRRLYGEKIERMLLDVVEQTVTEEIQRLKAAISGRSDDE